MGLQRKAKRTVSKAISHTGGLNNPGCGVSSQ
jgi:hypothetical protein